MIVNEIDLPLSIYKDILGMTVYYDKELVVSGNGLPTGVYNAQTRLVILQCNHPYVGMIGLLQYIDPPLPAPPPRPKPNRVQIGETVAAVPRPKASVNVPESAASMSSSTVTRRSSTLTPACPMR